MLQIDSKTELMISIIKPSDSSTNDIKTFVDILTKCHNDSIKPGFNKMFSESERAMIKDLYDSIVP